MTEHAIKTDDTKEEPERRFLTDGSGRWFDSNKAKHAWEDEEREEGLYVLNSGTLILDRWGKEECEEVSKEQAANWLAQHGYDEDDAVTAGVSEYWEDALGELEIA
jgi:hypothetical protein